MDLHVRRHATAAALLERAGAWLLEREAEHNLLIGLARRLGESAGPYAPPFYFATVEAGERVAGCAFRTPPWKLGLTRMPAEAPALLARDVAEVYGELPGTLGPPDVARRFAEQWAELAGVRSRVGMRQRIYELREVVFPTRPAQGYARLAGAKDSALVLEWADAFSREARTPAADPRVWEERVEEGGVLLWEDREPRSMAADVARTPNGARVGGVYTPPAWRKRGYASACVAALSERILSSGLRFCFLYTDLSNPTSNAIYQRLGYAPVCDVEDVVFG